MNERIATLTIISTAFLIAGCSDTNNAQSRETGYDPVVAERTLDQKADDSIEQAGNSISDTAESAGQYIDDSAITTTVKAKLVDADQLNALKIDVDTRDGIVTLEGTVPSQTARDLASGIASNVDGVQSVNNRLEVKSLHESVTYEAQPAKSEISVKQKTERTMDKVGDSLERAAAKTGQVIDDATVTATIKSRLIAEESLSALAIDVDTDDGEVILKGSVPSAAAKSLADTIASDVQGVVAVRNELEVDPSNQRN